MKITINYFPGLELHVTNEPPARPYSKLSVNGETLYVDEFPLSQDVLELIVARLYIVAKEAT